MTYLARRAVYPMLLACALALTACADSSEDDGSVGDAGAVASPLLAANNSFITLDGRVVTARPNSFTLNYGSGTITVEMDNWDLYAEGTGINAGDDVSVTGLIDSDLWERRSIEAGSVFVRNTNSFFYANSTDEEGGLFTQSYVPLQKTSSNAIGYVTQIEGREFTIGSGNSAVRVDTARMADNPLDQEGSPKIARGDRVYAYGTFQIEPNERAEIMASGVIKLLGPRSSQSARVAPTPTPASSPPTPAATAGVTPSRSPSPEQS